MVGECRWRGASERSHRKVVAYHSLLRKRRKHNLRIVDEEFANSVGFATAVAGLPDWRGVFHSGRTFVRLHRTPYHPTGSLRDTDAMRYRWR